MSRKPYTLHPSTLEVLQVLAELVRDQDESEVLRNCYGIDVDDPDEARLDVAISRWAQEGAPLPELENPLELER